MMKKILQIAVYIVNEQRKIGQSIRDLQTKLRELGSEAEKIERFISDNTNLYYCESCGEWKAKDKMNWTDDKQLTGRNKCTSCCDEKYYEHLAKSSINQNGISLYDAPPDLLEIEILRAKTRHELKKRKK